MLLFQLSGGSPFRLAVRRLIVVVPRAAAHVASLHIAAPTGRRCPMCGASKDPAPAPCSLRGTRVLVPSEWLVVVHSLRDLAGSYPMEAFAAPVHAPDFKSGVRL